MNYFKIPYFLFPFKEHIRLKDKILKSLNSQPNIEINNGKDNISETDWSRTDEWNTAANSTPYFDIFKEDFIKEIDLKFTEYKIGPWAIKNIWFQKYKTDDNHVWHKHGCSHWACVYYVDLPVNSPGTLLLDPLTNKEINLNQKEGDIFIFPSQIWHCSPKNLSKQEKTIIACNIDASVESI